MRNLIASSIYDHWLTQKFYKLKSFNMRPGRHSYIRWILYIM